MQFYRIPTKIAIVFPKALYLLIQMVGNVIYHFVLHIVWWKQNLRMTERKKTVSLMNALGVKGNRKEEKKHHQQVFVTVNNFQATINHSQFSYQFFFSRGIWIQFDYRLDRMVFDFVQCNYCRIGSFLPIDHRYDSHMFVVHDLMRCKRCNKLIPYQNFAHHFLAHHMNQIKLIQILNLNVKYNIEYYGMKKLILFHWTIFFEKICHYFMQSGHLNTSRRRLYYSAY